MHQRETLALAQMMPRPLSSMREGNEKIAVIQVVENGFIVVVQYPKKIEVTPEVRLKLRQFEANEGHFGPFDGEIDLGSEMVEETHVAKTWDEAVGIMAGCMVPPPETPAT